MARVPYLSAEDLAEGDRDLVKRGINLHRALVNSPGAARAFQGLGHYIRWDSKLDPRLRELAILQVGYVTRSAYEWSHHVKIAQEFGVSKDDLRALIDESEGRSAALGDLERTVLKAARDLTEKGTLSDATYDALARELGNEQVTDLMLTIGFYNAVVRILDSLRIDVEDSYQPYLDEFPLP